MILLTLAFEHNLSLEGTMSNIYLYWWIFFHFIYSSFIFLCEKEKTKSDQTHVWNKATGFTPMCKDGKILLSFALKNPDAFSHTQALTVDASALGAMPKKNVSHLTCSSHAFWDISLKLLFLFWFLSFPFF